MHNQIPYLFKKGIQNLNSNLWFSFISVITISACILLTGIFSAVCLNLSEIVGTISSDITISVFFQPEITDENIQSIGNDIRNIEYVETVTYISEQQAWDEYKQEYFNGIEELAAGFEEENPLENSNHYDVEINDVSKQFDVVQSISEILGVRQINQSQKTADVFSDINKGLILFSVGVITILFIISVFLIYTTVSSSISVRSEEINIMNIMGASSSFICSPFILESIIIGIVGTIFPLAIFHRIYSNVMQYISIRFESLSGLLDFIPEHEVFVFLIPIAILMGIVISLFGSVLSLKKQMKSSV